MSNRPTIAYQPALDGVRALAVIAVLLFHGEVRGFGGGYLGVSVFFTLSGFLITSLLVNEHDRTGRIDLANFYARRLRRLLPASAVCLVGVVVIAALTDLFDGVANLRAHVLGSVFQVANWVFLAGDGSYQDLLARSSGTSSPLAHFWSLAIEEQFYWFWPPVMLVLLTRVPRRRGRIVVVGALTIATAVAAPVIAQVWGPDAAYWATPARIAEIFVGALLAVIIVGRQAPEWVRWAAPAALVALAASVVTFPSASGAAYQGALPLVAIASGALVLGLQVDGPMQRLLALPAAVWIGKISYGLYLFHWPVFVLIHPDRFGWPGPVLLAVRLAVTLVITVLSYRLVEQPIRTAGRLGPSPTFVTAGFATAALIVVAITVVPAGFGEYWVADAATAEAAAIEVIDTPLAALVSPAITSATGTSSPRAVPTETTQPPATIAPSATTTSSTIAAPVATQPPPTIPPLPELARPVRIIVTGDSTAKAFGTGLVNWAAAHPAVAQVEIVGAPGCGFLRGGERRIGDTIGRDEGCDGWAEKFLYPAVERLQPDVVMVMVTSWDIIDRRWDTEELLSPLDAGFVDRLAGDYRLLVADLQRLGAGHVAFVRHPIPDGYWLPAVPDQEDPVRHAVIYGLYELVAAGSDGVEVVALDRWMVERDLDRSEDVRPDGIHPTPEAATALAEQYLGDQLVRIALELPRP